VARTRPERRRLPGIQLPDWTSSHRVGVAMIVAATVVTVAVAASGPSAVTLKLGRRDNFLPPWYVPVNWISLGEWVVVPALWAMLVIGSLGLWISWRAVNAGWRPNPRKLFALGTGLSIASSLIPPLTSADVLMYAAYGRLQVLGFNPYDITPAEKFRELFDPVLIWTERPWQDTPSVYGPLATWSQWLASKLGGENMHDTVFWLQMFTLVSFLIAAAIAVKLAHGDPKLQTRAVLFTVMNPLMLWGVLVGAHNEALSVVFAIAGLWFYRKHPFVAGIGIGLAGTVKVSMVFYGLAMVWGLRRDPRRLAQLCAGAAVPLVLAYGVWMPNALLAAQRNTGYISPGTWAISWLTLLKTVLDDVTARQIVAVTGWVLLVVLAWMLSRVLPWRLVPGDPDNEDPRLDPLTIAVRTTVVLCSAWLIASPWAFSWYDLITWMPLGLLWASRLDMIMMWRGAWLSVAWVTGRALQFGDQMHFVEKILREQVNVAAQIGVLVAIVWWWWSWGHELPKLPRISFHTASSPAQTGATRAD
jgi:alpha-1,6-mannosyltransferase